MSGGLFSPRDNGLLDLYPAELVDAVLAAGTSSRSPVHGVEHWLRVAANGAELAAETQGAQLPVVCLFALFHDAMRVNDGDDPAHGPRAAELALRLAPLLELGEGSLALLLEACKLHDRGLVSDDPTIGCCWDADRLDLPRVGTTPHPRFFSTALGRNRAGVLASTR